MMENEEPAVTTWRFDSQHDCPYFGRPCEEALAQLVQKNTRITKLGFQCRDPHWLKMINNAITHNADLARRAKKASTMTPTKRASDCQEKAHSDTIEKHLGKIFLETPPAQAAWEIFDDDDSNVHLVRQYLAERAVLPSQNQLQKFAKASGSKLKLKTGAKILRDVRCKLIDLYKSRQVTLYEGTNPFNGVLKSWSEKNDRFSFDLWTTGGQRFAFVTEDRPAVEVSREVVQWIMPEEKRVADDGQAYTYAEFVAYYGEREAKAKW